MTLEQLRVFVAVAERSHVTRAAIALNGAADLGFVEGRVDDPALVTQEVARDQMIIVVAPGHPWVGGRRWSASRRPSSACSRGRRSMRFRR